MMKTGALWGGRGQVRRVSSPQVTAFPPAHFTNPLTPSSLRATYPVRPALPSRFYSIRRPSVAFGSKPSSGGLGVRPSDNCAWSYRSEWRAAHERRGVPTIRRAARRISVVAMLARRSQGDRSVEETRGHGAVRDNTALEQQVAVPGTACPEPLLVEPQQVRAGALCAAVAHLG
jgi:hypothetical protein